MKAENYPLSPMETTLLAALGKRPLSSTDLIKIVYRGKKPPFHAAKSVLTVARSLQRKRRKVRSTERAGPYPIAFWIE